MTLFRLYLLAWLVVVTAYTAITISNHGLDFMPIFFGDMAAMAWPGQFNLDFLGFLTLSALWVMWRHRFSAGGLILGIVAFNGGIPFLCAYLLYQSLRHQADIETLLLGPSRISKG